jgi:hypothetical protein
MNHPTMIDDPRVERLRDLIARVERAPRSLRRDLLLLGVRDRIVTLDTGVEKSTVFGASTSRNRDGYRQRLSDLFR